MPKLTGATSADIDAPLDTVWELVANVEIAPQWQDGLDRLEPIDRDEAGRPTLVETESDAKVRKIKAKVRFSYEEPHRLTWTQEEGDVKSLTGSWVLEDLGDGRTRATYALEVDPGRVLGMLIRPPVEGKVRDILVNGRPGELKERVERPV